MIAADEIAAVQDYPDCRLRLSPEEACGDPAVAVDLGTDTGRCAAHVAEVMARTDYGWAHALADPAALGFASLPIEVVR